MRAIWKVFIGICIICLCIVSIIVYNWISIESSEESSASLELFPSTFSVYEENFVNFTLYFETRDGIPIIAPVEWDITTSGDAGEISSPSETDSLGNMHVIYYAPPDIDMMNQNITITAKTTWNNKTFTASINGIVHPFLHETTISIVSTKTMMIAGEKAYVKANVLGLADEKWWPLTNKTIQWTFFGREETAPGYKKLGEKQGKTNQLGICETVFFISDISANMTVIITAQFDINLSNDIDYMGCSDSLNISIIPEKPGDFPVVLIHGWIGSITDQLLNTTWWNLTQKLQQHGYTVLDFDVSAPGIQYLTYEPDMGNHHIPWIAGEVSKKIRDALVLNGYPTDQTIDIIGHSMGGLIARFMAEHGGADVDFWNTSWKLGDDGYPWYGDGDTDVYLTGDQIDDIFLVGTPCHGVPPGINETILSIIGYLYFPWWIGQIPDMIYHSTFLGAMGYNGSELVDYHSIGSDIGFIVGDPMDFDGDGIAHTSDGLVPTESPYLKGTPLLIVIGEGWPNGNADHLSQIAINNEVHTYILDHLT